MIDESKTTHTFRSLRFAPLQALDDIITALTALPLVLIQVTSTRRGASAVLLVSPHELGSDFVEALNCFLRAGGGSSRNPSVISAASAFSRAGIAALFSVADAALAAEPAFKVLRPFKYEPCDPTETAPRPSMRTAWLAACAVREELAGGAPMAILDFVVEDWVVAELGLIGAAFASPAALPVDPSAEQAAAILALPAYRTGVNRGFGYALRVAVGLAHRVLNSSAADSTITSLARNMLALCDDMCSSTITTEPGIAPTAAHVAAAVASGSLQVPASVALLSTAATAALPASPSLTPIVAPSALGPAIAQGRRAPRADRAEVLNGLIAPSAPLLAFAAAMAAKLGAMCTVQRLTQRRSRFFVDLVHSLLADRSLATLWHTAVRHQAVELPCAEFSLGATSAAVHAVVVRQFARTYVRAWLRNGPATSSASQQALRSRLRASSRHSARGQKQRSTSAVVGGTSSSVSARAGRRSKSKQRQVSAQSSDSAKRSASASDDVSDVLPAPKKRRAKTNK